MSRSTSKRTNPHNLPETPGQPVEGGNISRVDTPWWVHRAIRDHESRVTWITGGLGSGKTTGAALWFINRWFENKYSSFSWAIAPTYTKVEQILIPAIRQVLLDVFGYVQDQHYIITKSPFWKVRIDGYHHELHLLSGDRPQHFVGSNIATWWVTEPGLQDRAVYEKIQNRLRCPKAQTLQGIAEGTPEGLNWYADLADLPGIGYDRYDKEKKHRRFIVETTFNEHLRPSPESYAQTQIRDVYAYDKNKILSYEKGLFVPFTKGSAYWEWVESRNLTTGTRADPSLTLDLCFDFNVSPLAWVVCQQFVHQQHYYSPRIKKYTAIQESSGESRGLMDGIAEFAAHYPVAVFGHTPIEVWGDASGWARNLHSAGSDYAMIEQYLTALGYRNVTIRAARSNPLVKHRLEKTAALMAYERFVADARCRRLIQSFVKTSLIEGTFDIEKPSGEDWTHYADACTYYLFQSAKDIDITAPRTRKPVGATM